MRRVVPELPAESLFVAGDLRADVLLGGMRAPVPGLLGVFSGWRGESLFSRAAEDWVGFVETWMDAHGYDRAVITGHPNLTQTRSWPTTERAIAGASRLSLVAGNEWEAEFANCEAYVGDSHTSLFDVLSCTGRPLHQASWTCDELQIADPRPATNPVVDDGWLPGGAAAASVARIRDFLVVPGER
jgi:hypothetical protein